MTSSSRGRFAAMLCLLIASVTLSLPEDRYATPAGTIEGGFDGAVVGLLGGFGAQPRGTFHAAVAVHPIPQLPAEQQGENA